MRLNKESLSVNIDMNNFNNEVLNSEKPVLLDFWAPRCGHCRSLMPLVDQLAGEREDIKVAKINVDEQPELARQFGIRSLPTLMVMKHGEIVSRSVGSRPRGAILEMLQ